MMKDGWMRDRAGERREKPAGDRGGSAKKILP